jgi:hypothetical protein
MLMTIPAPLIPPARPPVFIGSSTEQLEIAEALQVLLDRDCDTQLWRQGLFAPGRSYLESLVRALPAYDFAVLVITPDDKVTSRDQSSSATRDNILFELGLFMGRLGRDRAFAVYDRTKSFKLPSDFAGIQLVDYQPSQRGHESALGPASIRIMNAIRAAPPRQAETERKLNQLQKSVIDAGEIGPEEQAFFDKLTQVMVTSGNSDLTLLYADIDGLRSLTRRIFVAEKDRQASGNPLRRRPEADIRQDFVLALNVSITDAIYQLHPDGLKHDIFALPDPDAAVIARKLTYESALQVADRVRASFREEAERLGLTSSRELPDVSILVATQSFLDPELIGRGSADVHRYLRKRLKDLKEDAGRGKVYGREALRLP